LLSFGGFKFVKFFKNASFCFSKKKNMFFFLRKIPPSTKRIEKREKIMIFYFLKKNELFWGGIEQK
jgi:hypothetical protein